ncbi:WD repeat-containing protein 64 [Tritrichomonas musculus]|uniref:WD repeat-containing protein 64 n=1 Tax=Tritrichomonas musculus TaxID=1915356 RepID=A0ABR2JKV5_9EUKA
MNADITLKLSDQIAEMKRQENEWESEKSNIQSKISSLKEEEKEWLSLKDNLLSRLRILRSAAAAPSSKREEILSELSSQPSFHLSNTESSQEDIKSSNSSGSLSQSSSSSLISPGTVKKKAGAGIKRRKSLMPKSPAGSPKASSPKSPDQPGALDYNIKWSLSQHLDCVRCATFHPTLPYIATGSDDGSIRITNLDPQKKTRTKNPVPLLSLRGHSGPILSLAAYNNFLISGDVNGQICVWDFSETKSSMNESHGRVDHHIQYFANNHSDAVWSIATHENSTYYISASADQTIRINDINTQESIPIQIPDGPTVASFNSDGSIFVVGCSNGHIHIFENKQNIGDYDLQSRVISICRSASKDEILIACEDKNIKVFDIANREVKKQFIAHESYTSAMDITSDGHFLVTTSPDKTIRVWTIPDFDVVSVDNHHREKYGEAGLCVAATRPSNSHEYFASGGADGVVKIFVKSK